MQAINGLFVYTYRHDDDRQGWIPLASFSFDSTSGPQKEVPSAALIEKVTTTFKECGWEGDGELGAMMVPPFFSSDGQTHWFPIFHVKQSHRGTSWIASEHELSTENLEGESKTI